MRGNILYNRIMNTMPVFLIIFFLVSVFHITATFMGKGTLRKMSKIFIVPPLLAAFIAGAAPLGGGFQSMQFLFPVLALMLGWTGDVLFIRKDKKIYFKLGLVSFLLGHICYIITYISLLGFFTAAPTINVTAMAISIPLAIITGVMLLRFIKPSKELLVPVIFYMIVIETMAVWGLQVFIFNPGIAGTLILLGCLCFILSDTILAYYTFRRINRMAAALLISFYILAQAGIILGVLFVMGIML